MTQENPTVIDISRAISPDSVVYPEDPPLGMEKLCTVSGDAPCDITTLEWTTHFLTHVDPPAHFVEDGDTLDDVPVNRWIGRALVIEVDGDEVDAADIPNGPDLEGASLLFKTRNSTLSTTEPFDEDHAYVSAEAAQKVVENDVNLVGIDYLGVDQYDSEEYPAHNTLLGNHVLILEGIELHSVEPGEYLLIALPLKIDAEYGDGSPVRAVLIPEEEAGQLL